MNSGYFMDTIFAPICSLGGSIVSVRFSGSDAYRVFDFFKISKDLYSNKDLFFTKLVYNGNLLDEVVIKIFRKPHSFTGEDVVEIDLHASYIILKDFLKLVISIPNFRFAKNGEFSKRAFLNGKIDLIKAEGINAIIKAETKKQQQLANEMFGGKIYKRYNDIRDKLLHALSFIEVNIDFSEEEIPQHIINEVKDITKNLINELTVCINDKAVIDKINNGISVAIIGKPNVGKSTLLNWLAKRDVAIVSPIAGTTRDVLHVDLELDGYKVIFYDTAGIRDSDNLIEQEGIKRARDTEKNADLCIYIFDDVLMDKDLENLKRDNSIIVLNKSDLRNFENRNKNCIEISLLKNKNLDILLDTIKKHVVNIVEMKQNPMVMNERHNLLLLQCVDILKNIDFEKQPIEIIGEELRIASDKIGQIIGKIYTEDVLDIIFSKFCIGK